MNDSAIMDRLEAEFNMEILLKYEELRFLEQELEKTLAIIEALQKVMINEHVYGREAHASDAFAKSTAHSTPLSDAHQARAHKKAAASKSSEPAPQYELRSDGAIVW